MQDDFVRPPKQSQPSKPVKAPVASTPEESAATSPVVASDSASMPSVEALLALSNTPTTHSRRKPWVMLVVSLVLLVVMAVVAWWAVSQMAPKKPAQTATKASTQSKAATSTVTGLELDTSKNYGNKYADGVLPVGDGKYKTDTAATGYVYACSGYAQNLSTSSGGAGSRGPWFSSDGKTYDINKKKHVNGSVTWQSSFSNSVTGATRTIITNDLPNHPTGVFPIAASDPAYAYDKNPNKISAQSFTYALPASPTYGNPNCMGGQSGVMLTGVAIFSGFDAGGRDAGAWEVQDDCEGHPEKTGTYHYHTLSSCIKDTSVSTVIGFALDGFPITGPKVGTNNILTTDDLDECHGIASEITLDGKKTTTYHYVMTEDFPYSVSCFRAAPTQPPGQQGPGVRQQ